MLEKLPYPLFCPGPRTPGWAGGCQCADGSRRSLPEADIAVLGTEIQPPEAAGHCGDIAVSAGAALILLSQRPQR